MSDEGKIDKFNFKNLTKNKNPYRNYALIGPTQSGKTTVIKTILYYLSPLIRYVVIVSASAQMDNEYKGMIPDIYTYENYSEDVISNILDDQMTLKKKIEDHICPENVKKMVVIIFDDIIGTESKWKKNELMDKIMTAGRHFYISFIISVQNPIFVPAKMRENMGYTIATSINTEKRMKTFYEQFVKNCRYDTFLKIYKTIMKEKYNLIVLDNATGGNTDKLNKYLFYGRAIAPNKFPKGIRIGIRRVWELNSKYFDPNHLYKKSKKKGGEIEITLAK